MSNELVVRYDSDYGAVELTRSVVRNYLTKGNIKILDEEVDMYMEICKRQRLDPFVGGEVHLIKYKEGSPAQIVIGYRTYVRRAEENPKFIMKQDGIIVQRATQVIAKEGTCLYPNEKLLGGWCKAFLTKGGGKAYVYKEISLGEFYQDTRKWKESPAFMINKVAIAQALRDAFPKELNGLYIEEEAETYSVADRSDNNAPLVTIEVEQDGKAVEIEEKDRLITKAEAKKLFTKAYDLYGKEEGPLKLKALMEKDGIESTSAIMLSKYKEYLETFMEDNKSMQEAFKQQSIEEVESEIVESEGANE